VPIQISDAVKRSLDFGFALVLLTVLLPLLCLIALLVACTLGRPVLFRQWRAGRQGAGFALLKFRTMTEQRNEHASLLPDEQRLTRLGSFLRTSSLDELPELINVLRGDMSLVGPRPLLLRYVERYTPEQRRRLEVRPGITGWAQVNGRNAIGWEKKFALDVWYVDHRSVWLDMRILCLTAWRVLRREGIAHDAHSTMPEFRPETEGPHS
jgi:sugar transferase EpsL